MISLKKYLESQDLEPKLENGSGALPIDEAKPGKADEEKLPLALCAYGSALRTMGECSLDACPAMGQGLKLGLAQIAEGLSVAIGHEALEFANSESRRQMQDWGQRTAAHYRQKTAEVKGLLLVMARTAESVGERDQRCAGQISEVTRRLQTIASLEDLTEIRSSIESSAAELKTSLDRMAHEGKQAIDALRAEVAVYQVKLEEAEELACRDALTGLHNRFWVESQIEQRIGKGGPMTLAIVDIDAFKAINDRHGHLVGDEILKQFSRELKSASRSTDVIGRWGGDEFILVLNCPLSEAEPQLERLRAWVCGDYSVAMHSGPMKLKVDASIGLAELAPAETMKGLLARADAAMYGRKAASRAKEKPRP